MNHDKINNNNDLRSIYCLAKSTLLINTLYTIKYLKTKNNMLFIIFYSKLLTNLNVHGADSTKKTVSALFSYMHVEH